MGSNDNYRAFNYNQLEQTFVKFQKTFEQIWQNYSLDLTQVANREQMDQYLRRASFLLEISQQRYANRTDDQARKQYLADNKEGTGSRLLPVNPALTPTQLEIAAPGLSELINPLTVLQIDIDMATEMGVELNANHLTEMQNALAELTGWMENYRMYVQRLKKGNYSVPSQ